MSTVKYLGLDLPLYKSDVSYEELAEFGKMTYKKSLGISVLEAAKARARYIFNAYDNVVVGFSGGKDSLVVLELMDMVRIEMGIEKKLKVVFYDEELIPFSVVEFVDQIRRTGRFDLDWYCVPLRSKTSLFGKKSAYTQWDEGREWIRPKPDWAIKDIGTGGASITQYQVSQYYTANLEGSTCMCLGLRASESLNRLMGVRRANNKELPFITGSDFSKKVHNSKIIYDWSTKDVFKFFYDFSIKYCYIYDQQSFSRTSVKSAGNYRVATVIYDEAMSKINLLKKYDPKFFDRVCEVFPHVAIASRYNDEYRHENIYEKYPVTKEGDISVHHRQLYWRNARHGHKQVSVYG